MRKTTKTRNFAVRIVGAKKIKSCSLALSLIIAIFVGYMWGEAMPIESHRRNRYALYASLTEWEVTYLEGET